MKSRFSMVAAFGLLWIGAALAQVNINTATREELDGLKGIGPVKAQAIVDYRRKNGPFKAVGELEKVPGIGPATVKDLRGEVVVGGAPRSPAPVARPLTETPRSMARPAVPATPARPPMPAKPALAVPARPAMPGKRPDARAMDRLSAPAAPAKPAMPGQARPAVPMVKPASPAIAPARPAMPMAQPAVPAIPAKPAAPARPAQPAGR